MIFAMNFQFGQDKTTCSIAIVENQVGQSNRQLNGETRFCSIIFLRFNV